MLQDHYLNVMQDSGICEMLYHLSCSVSSKYAIHMTLLLYIADFKWKCGSKGDVLLPEEGHLLIPHLIS